MAGDPQFDTEGRGYAGDIGCADAWDLLQNDPNAVLVDVRTQVEWQLVGRPDLTQLGKEPVFLQWVTMQGVNQNFVEQLEAELATRGVSQDTPVLFLCQSGGRSQMAAKQCTELGYRRAYNMHEGFDGSLDEHQHRASINGWKVAGLPWVQS